ncbi:N/A [soil metagenome]
MIALELQCKHKYWVPSMKKFLLSVSLSAAAMVAVATTAIAADYSPPPPPEELRPSDWTGPYVGGFVSGVFVEGRYDATPICPAACTPNDPDISGAGFAGGVVGGFNYDLGGFLLGVEGDWAWGDSVADNDDPAEDTELKFDNIATIRARAGFLMDNTLVYATGGVAFVDANFGGEVGDPAGIRIHADDSQWVTGWVVGGGMEHAFTEGLHGRIEYLYASLPDQDFDLSTGNANNPGGSVDVDFEGVHMVRAGLTYNFGTLF